MAKYRLQNESGKKLDLNNIPYEPNEYLYDSDEPCGYVNLIESIAPDLVLKKIPITKEVSKDYKQAKLECNGVNSDLETYHDDTLPNNNSANNGQTNGEEDANSLGSQTDLNQKGIGSDKKNDSTKNDPNSLPPQAPPAGEAEERSKDEEMDIPKVADPVNPFTGEFYIEKVDFELPSVGFPFVFIRTYKSGRTFFGPFGYNWDHNYNVYLRILNNGSIAINTGGLHEDIYTDSGDSIVYNPPRGVFAKLERIQNSDFILIFKGGMKWYFKHAGFERIPLVKMEDTNGNSQQLIYNNKNQLETVVDTVGRKINFIYGSCDLLEGLEPDIFQDNEFEPKLTATKKHCIQYLHANNIEQLSAVITFPTPDFPNGLMTCYEYDEDQALPELRNNILRVIDAKGQTIVENIYGTDTTDDSFNRIVKQYFMGGEYLFKYTNIRYIPPFDEYINDAYLQTEFYEPERPLKVLTFNFRGNLLDERFRLCADGSYRVWSQSYRYNKNGQMTEFYYANGMADIYEYYEHDPNNPASVIEKDGNLLRVFKLNTLRLNPRKIAEYSYENNFQKVETVTDEANTTIKFKYDGNGNLIKIIYPDALLPDGTVQNNCETNLKYDPSGQLVEELSPEARKKTYDYFLNGSGAGLVKKITTHDNVSPLTKSFEYDALGNIKRAIDGFGNDTLFEHNLIGQLVKTELPSVNSNRAIYKFEYNEDRKIAKEYLPKGNYSDPVLSDSFIVNEYFYDVASWLVEVRKFSNTASQQITKIQRDFFGNVIKLINPIGQEFRNKYDDRNLILEEIKFSNTEAPLKTQYHYDRIGNLDKVTYPDGNIETFSYNDPYSRLVSQTNLLGVVQEYTYGGVRDEITQKIIKDSLGAVLQTHKFSFDEKGRLKTSDINGLTSQLYYDRDNLTVKAINHQKNTTKIEYDGIGRTVLVTDPLGNRQASAYDANGNIISNDIQSLTIGGNYVSLNQQVSYDERSRPIKTTDPLGNIVSFIYDDRNLKTSVINALGQKVNLYYDINGLTIKSGLLRAGNEIIINQWNRDSIGRLISYQDAENNLTKYFYDERSNLVQTQYSDNSTVTKEYDVLGFLKKEIDCNGTVSNFSYNPLGQLTQLDFQVNGGALPTPALTYAYDSFGRQNIIARGVHAITKKFDNFNRLIEEKQGTETIKKIFDDVNNIISLSFPDGRIDKYKLDELSRVKEVVFDKKGTENCLVYDFNEGTILSTYEYEGLFLKSKKYANNAVTEYNYDIEGRLSGMNVKDGLGNSIDKEQYLYDGDKRKRIIVRDSLPNTNKLFNYDELSRLTESYTGLNAAIPNNLSDQQSIDNFLSGINTNTPAHSEKYFLSNNDRRDKWIIDGVQFDTAYNNLLQLNSISGGANINYTYDKNGNRISDDQFQYSYDALDNLVKVVRKSDNVTLLEHSYDGEDRIIERKENNISNLFFYDGLRSIQEKLQGGNTLQNTFGFGLDEYIVQSKDQSNYFYHQNGILSLNCLTDKNCIALQYFDFSSFGSPSAFDSGKNIIPSANSLVSFLFSGRPQISSINKYDFRKRVYDQLTGLFVQRDVTGHLESNNKHQYCAHDPVNRRDALGLVSDTWAPKLSGVAPATADERENMRTLISDTSFGIANAVTAGGLKKMVDRKSTGFVSDFGANAWIGVTTLSNMASLGFQDSIYNGVKETKGDLTDWHFNTFGETSGILPEIGYGLAASVLGTGRGAVNNVVSLLPVEEANILLNSSSSTADKWGAVFSGISKVAGLVAMKTGASKSNPVLTGPKGKVGVGFAPSQPSPNSGLLGQILGKAGHIGLTVGELFYDKVTSRGGKNPKVREFTSRPSEFDVGRPFEYTEVEVPLSGQNSVSSFANSKVGPSTYNAGFDNCGQFTGKGLSKAGIIIPPSYPLLANMMFKNFPFLLGTMAQVGITNGAVQQTEKKK